MITLREARPGEAVLLAELQERASVAALQHIFPPELYPYPRPAIRDNWDGALADPTRTVVVAETKEPVGVVCAGDGWLEALYVAPEHWGAGVADVLHDRVLELVREGGAAECRLWVLESNQRARRFYERRGWHENGDTRVVPYPPNPIDVGYTIELETTLATP
jgi:GNAT superfamily N-acetyltransferase